MSSVPLYPSYPPPHLGLLWGMVYVPEEALGARVGFWVWGGGGGASPLALLHWRIKRWPGWAWCWLPGLAGLWGAKGSWGVSPLLPMGMREVDSQREPSSP